MDSSQKGRAILGGVIVLLLAAVMVYMWSDSIFPSKDSSPTANPNVSAVNNAVGGNGQPEPDPANPAPRNSGRMKAPGR